LYYCQNYSKGGAREAPTEENKSKSPKR